MEEHYVDITKLPYAEWLEDALKSMSALPLRTIAILGVTENGDMYNDYYNANVGDKIMISGFVQQDAMYESLKASGYITDDDDEEAGSYESEE